MWWVDITRFRIIGMNLFQRFDMVVNAPPLLKMSYNNLDGDHRRTLDVYVGALTELINMNGWTKLIDVLTSYYNNEQMVIRLKNEEITLTIEEL